MYVFVDFVEFAFLHRLDSIIEDLCNESDESKDSDR